MTPCGNGNKTPTRRDQHEDHDRGKCEILRQDTSGVPSQAKQQWNILEPISHEHVRRFHGDVSAYCSHGYSRQPEHLTRISFFVAYHQIAI